MAKKQAVLNPSSAAGAAPARAAKAATPRTRAGKHSKAAVSGEKPAETAIAAAELVSTAQVEQFLMSTPAPAVAENPIEFISRLAYGYWQARGYQGGNALEDWVRAEDEYRRLQSL